MSTTQPTQVARPWRATVRTIVQAVVGFAAMWAVIVEAIGLNSEWQWVSASLVVTAAITRVMALPQVEAFLRRFAPFLAADPDPTPARHRDEAGISDLAFVIGLLVVALVVVLIFTR